MSIRKKLTELLRGQQEAEEPEIASAPGEPQPPRTGTAPPAASAAPQVLLELDGDHPLTRLYQMCREEGMDLPAPRLCLDGEGALPPDAARRELDRLRTVLAGACGDRIKEARGQKRAPAGKKRKSRDSEDPVKSQEDAPPVLDAKAVFFLSADQLWAWALALPPMGGGREMTRERLAAALADRGITYGVEERLADRLVRGERRYFTLYPAARGRPAFDGKNGNIVDSFPRSLERTLEVDEYDQVDYTALNLIHNVDKGQEICRLIKPTEGEPGRSVLDQEIPAKGGKNVLLPRGKNTEISADGTQLLASIAGSVEFTGGAFQVLPVMDVSGDVDFSTGSINFLGDVNIRGNVLSGFTVRAMGSVRVEGVVESGAAVDAGGDLVVAKGIMGGGTAAIQAKGSVFAKYVENATVSAGELLQTDCIVGSTVYCGGEVVVQSGRGSILGGEVWAARRVAANSVGSQWENRTRIILGGDPCADFEREAVRREAGALEQELERLKQQPESPVRASLQSKARLKLKTAQMKLRQLEERTAPKEDGGRLECAAAYPGTEIRAGSAVLRLHALQRRCVITPVCGEIVVM